VLEDPHGKLHALLLEAAAGVVAKHARLDRAKGEREGVGGGHALDEERQQLAAQGRRGRLHLPLWRELLLGLAALLLLGGGGGGRAVEEREEGGHLQQRRPRPC
jgi:hypothetical protein